MTTADLTAIRDQVREMRLDIPVLATYKECSRDDKYVRQAIQGLFDAEESLTLAAYHRGLAEPKGESPKDNSAKRYVDMVKFLAIANRRLRDAGLETVAVSHGDGSEPVSERQRRVDAGLGNGGPVKIEAYGPSEHKRRRGVCDIPPPATGWQEAGNAAMEIRCEQCGELVKGLTHSCEPVSVRVRPPAHPVTVEEARAAFGEEIRERESFPRYVIWHPEFAFCREASMLVEALDMKGKDGVVYEPLAMTACEKIAAELMPCQICDGHGCEKCNPKIAKQVTQIKAVAEEKCIRCNGEKVVWNNELYGTKSTPCPLCQF